VTGEHYAPATLPPPPKKKKNQNPQKKREQGAPKTKPGFLKNSRLGLGPPLPPILGGSGFFFFLGGGGKVAGA